MPKWRRHIPTHATYLYRVVFRQQDLPLVPRRFCVPELPPTKRDIWVNRRGRDLLKAIEPYAIIEKHEARRCPSCGRLFVGIQAKILREMIESARISGNKVTCSKACATLTAS